MKTGIELIAKEREEQIKKHGRTIRSDVAQNDNDQLETAAMMLLAQDFEEGIDSESFPDGWDVEACKKMLSKSKRERLIIAGALIAAALDREIYLLHELKD